VGLPIRLTSFDRDELEPNQWKLLVSTVPAGAADPWADKLAAGEISIELLFDVVYDPWPTRLAVAAAGSEVPVIGGFDLLLHQAAEQVRLMTGLPAPVESMRRAGLAEVAARYR